MAAPKKAQSPEPKPEARTVTQNDNTTVLLGFPQTTRTCAAQWCWCRIGDYPSPLVMDHAAELARMAREIRSLEIAGGVLGI